LHRVNKVTSSSAGEAAASAAAEAVATFMAAANVRKCCYAAAKPAISKAVLGDAN